MLPCCAEEGIALTPYSARASGCLSGACAQHDDFDGLREQILGSDMLVFATPLYYYDMTAQLKAMVDHFCSANPRISGKRLKSSLLAVAWNDDDWTFDALEAPYDTLVRYLNLRDCGRALGGGCRTPGMTRRSGYPGQARALGRSL